jgi:hypothetical protein
VKSAWLRDLIPVILAAILPYLTTVDDYFVRDDFGVVQLLASKPASYFPHWFVSSWMDDIWGFIPDEIRPFPALSYQLTALGGAGSPVLHHLLNILLHATNGVLVMWIARFAADLSRPAAVFAGVAFVLLPVHTESVAWITGRVDSMPALFYLAAFAAYVRWRQGGEQPARWYFCSLLMFFFALFSKQNTITMLATLVTYDVIVGRMTPWRVLSSAPVYAPFAVMTAGYLGLRYVLFGQVAREGALNAQAIEGFFPLIARHLRHVVTGDLDGSQTVVWLVLAVFAALLLQVQYRQATSPDGKRDAGVLLYFGPVWWAIGVAPVAVAGYASPRHVYLAAVGWAVVLGFAFDRLLRARASMAWRRAAWVVATIVLVLYLVSLHASIHDWHVMAAVSEQAVQDVSNEAGSARPGSLFVIGAPTRSWEWALPFAARPPFARTDLTTRVHMISPRPLSCCSPQWFDETRRTLKIWSAGDARDSVVILRWDEASGALSKATERDSPDLAGLARALGEIQSAEVLDANLRRIVDVFPSATTTHRSTESGY